MSKVTIAPSSAAWAYDNHSHAQITIYMNEECSEQVILKRTFENFKDAYIWRGEMMEMLKDISIEVSKEKGTV
jgi:hypothetical protein